MASPHRGPGSIRTARHIAIDKGADPRGFVAERPYCYWCGFPLDSGLPHGHYEEMEEALKDAKNLPQKFEPFKLGK